MFWGVARVPNCDIYEAMTFGYQELVCPLLQLLYNQNHYPRTLITQPFYVLAGQEVFWHVFHTRGV